MKFLWTVRYDQLRLAGFTEKQQLLQREQPELVTWSSPCFRAGFRQKLTVKVVLGGDPTCSHSAERAFLLLVVVGRSDLKLLSVHIRRLMKRCGGVGVWVGSRVLINLTDMFGVSH